jgi:hypothetical protein
LAARWPPQRPATWLSVRHALAPAAALIAAAISDSSNDSERQSRPVRVRANGRALLPAIACNRLQASAIDGWVQGVYL